MREIIAGALLLGVAVMVRGRRSERFGAALDRDFRDEALEQLRKAAGGMYPRADEAFGEPTWSRDDYEPQCDVFTQRARRAFEDASEAADMDLVGGKEIQAVAVQAWSLALDPTMGCAMPDLDTVRLTTI